MNNSFKRDPKTARMGHEILPLEMGYLPEFFKRKAEVELKDTPENRKRGLAVLRDMMANDKHFYGTTFDEDFLLQYLRCRKFDAARAFSQLKSFVNLRRKNPTLFRNFEFRNIVRGMEIKGLSILPYRCQDGCVIVLIQLDNWIPEEYPPEEIKRTAIIYLLQTLRYPMTQVNGFKAIFDVKSNPIKHIKYATPSNVHLIYYGPMECSPGRFKEVHILNQSATFRAAWLIIKPFLGAKIKSRIHFHNNPEELLDFFPAACLPEEYGGELKDYDMSNWLSYVMKPENLKTLGGGGTFPIRCRNNQGSQPFNEHAGRP